MTWAARLLSILAIAGYLANGALAHVMPGGEHAIHVGVCDPSGQRVLTIVVGDAPAEETTHTCCGECTSPSAMAPDLGGDRILRFVRFASPVPSAPTEIGSRAPFWPGAPPHGPPDLRNA